MFPLSLGY